jgi:hypothetical protein
MTPVPRTPLLLGLAGLLPFLWGTLTVLSPALSDWTIATLGPQYVAPFVSLSYGTIILAFMSGVLWGFATRAEGAQAATGYALSVIPALWAFFFVGGGPTSAAIHLSAGFAGLLALDWSFWRQGRAPPWWMTLRIGLTIVVLLSLAPLWL